MISFELNLRKGKLMFICIYRLPSQNKQYFLENLSEILDHYFTLIYTKIILYEETLIWSQMIPY